MLKSVSISVLQTALKYTRTENDSKLLFIVTLDSILTINWQNFDRMTMVFIYIIQITSRHSRNTGQIVLPL